MGSGKYLKYSQEKHGIENFSKEAEIVNDEFIAEEKVSKKIKKDDLDEWLDKGWVQGRKIKF